MPKSTGNWIKEATAVLIFVLLVALIFPFRWNHIAYFNNSIDLLGTVWSVSHVSEAISSGQNPWITSQMLAPQGLSILSHTSVFIVGVVDSLIKNPVLSLNVVMVVNFVLLAWGFYKLTSIWISDPWIQTSVATMTVFTAYYQSKFGIHINLLLQCSVPWAAYFMLKSVSLQPFITINHKPKFILGCIITIVGLFFDYYTAILLLFLLLPWVLWDLWVHDKLLHGKKKHWWAVIVALVVIHGIGRVYNMGGFDKKGGIWEAADIQQLFIPSSLGRWIHSNTVFPQSPITENFIYIGWSLIISLIIIGLIFLYKKRKFHFPNNITFLWFAVVVSLIVVLPVIRLQGKNLWYTPSALMHYVPGLDHFRMPTRMIPIVHFYGAMLVFIYLYSAKSKLKLGYIPLILLITTSFLIEHKTKTPKYFSMKDYSLSQTDKDLLPNNTVLSFPWGVRDGLKELGKFNAFDYVLMMQPDVKLVSAYISRISSSRWQQIQSDSFFLLINKTQQIPNCPWTNKQKQLAKQGLDSRKITLLRVPVEYSYIADRFKSIKDISWIETKTPNCLYLLRNNHLCQVSN